MSDQESQLLITIGTSTILVKTYNHRLLRPRS
jgi:hypothetical protein